MDRLRTTEQELLAAACAGDQDAFRRLVEPPRAALQAHCYRMLGSVHDAEDALQDALLRAWRGLCAFDGRSALLPWLYRITTNACLDALARRRRRVLPVDYGALAELRATDALADGKAAPAARYEQREAVELAVAAALQHLPPRQRAVLILREVLGFSAREAAASLGTTVASVNSALQRARQVVNDPLSAENEQRAHRSLGGKRERAVAQRFVDAFERADVDAIVALATDDATFRRARELAVA